MALRNPKMIVALFLAALAAGCASGPHSSADAPSVTLLADKRVILDSTVVQLDHGSVEITGEVHRQTASTEALSGRVDIEFVGPDGEVLDGLPVLIDPRELSPARPSTYHVIYGYIPPKGSTLRIHFVDADTEAREDLEGGMYDAGLDNGGGIAGGVSGGGAGGHGGRAGAGRGHYATGHGMGFGSNFGAHNFGGRTR